jgi:hypothetical protein
VDGMPNEDTPTYTFEEGTPVDIDAVAASLPFQYSLRHVSWGIESQRFTTKTGQICNYLKL